MLCEQISGIEVVKAFDNPEVLLREVSNLEFDFCILDIEMPQISGLQIANLLSVKPIIFATAYKEFAADAFDLNAVDYIRKPLSLERLRQAIDKLILRIEKDEVKAPKQFIQINTDKGKALMFFDQLCYIKTSETDSRDKIARLTDGGEIVLKNISFERLSEMLPPYDFCRINKKELIALKIVRLFSFDEITTTLKVASGKNLSLTLSDSYRKNFLQKVKI
jgi:DNA-binding LytR/AlgR family response regulator